MKAWVWRTLLGASPLVIVIIIRYVSAIRRRTYIRGEKVDEIEVARLFSFLVLFSCFILIFILK